jgi:hypothetical protein
MSPSGLGDLDGAGWTTLREPSETTPLPPPPAQADVVLVAYQRGHRAAESAPSPGSPVALPATTGPGSAGTDRTAYTTLPKGLVGSRRDDSRSQHAHDNVRGQRYFLGTEGLGCSRLSLVDGVARVAL